MMQDAKISAVHRQRLAVVYVRQSSPTQLERNRESTLRQYNFVARAIALGWAEAQVLVIDEDQGVSANGLFDRAGFAQLTAEVALGRVGIVLGLEVARLARNNADWYRLLDLCGLTDTVLADDDGVYDPSSFNDRLLLGLKGTMSEAELHILRARLNGGIRNKAARGELRRGLPVGLVWGDEDGEVRLHPDAAVTTAMRTVFDRFTELGSVRRVWLWFRSEELLFPFRRIPGEPIQWVKPTYLSIHHVLSNPVYAGAYTYGKTRRERYLDATGRVRQRTRHLARGEWSVLIPEHHPGYISWQTYLANQERISANIRPRAHEAGGAVREGAALLQGLAVCGRCGRRLNVFQVRASQAVDAIDAAHAQTCSSTMAKLHWVVGVPPVGDGLSRLVAALQQFALLYQRVDPRVRVVERALAKADPVLLVQLEAWLLRHQRVVLGRLWHPVAGCDGDAGQPRQSPRRARRSRRGRLSDQLAGRDGS